MHNKTHERMTIDLPFELKREAKMIAVSKGITLKAYVQKALEKQIIDDEGNDDQRSEAAIKLNNKELSQMDEWDCELGRKAIKTLGNPQWLSAEESKKLMETLGK